MVWKKVMDLEVLTVYLCCSYCPYWSLTCHCEPVGVSSSGHLSLWQGPSGPGWLSCVRDSVLGSPCAAPAQTKNAVSFGGISIWLPGVLMAAWFCFKAHWVDRTRKCFFITTLVLENLGIFFPYHKIFSSSQHNYLLFPIIYSNNIKISIMLLQFY